MSNKISFKELTMSVEKLQNEFNAKLVSVLESCEQPVIISVIPPCWGDRSMDDSIKNPVLVNVAAEKDVFRHAHHVYSASSTHTII